MAFGETTIKQALDMIRAPDNTDADKFAMPAIQRRFVWLPGQIAKLFDSLMQGYPVGSFLFWEVKSETVPKYIWYDFVLDYHEKDSPDSPIFKPNTDYGLTAILDGQQRLTALNIGLGGTYADKLPRLHRKNPHAYPEKRLYLNIASELRDDESGMKYDFRFLTRKQFEDDGGYRKWFSVADVMPWDDEDAGGPHSYAMEHGLMDGIITTEDRTRASDIVNRLARLRRVVHENDTISFFSESDQDLEKMLNIFVRTNSGGTRLTNSDLLLSIATASFSSDINARQEVLDRTKELNAVGDGFNFPHDFILKAGLVLSDINDIGFKVRNFNTENMRRLESQWESITTTLYYTVELAAKFGLSSHSLTSQNALLPIAYWMNKNGMGDDFVSSVAYADERERIKTWLFQSLLKRGMWGGASDTRLARLRAVLRRHDGDRFPASELWQAATGVSSGPAFSDEELDHLLDTPKGRTTFVILSLLYPFVDVANNTFHIDHVMPKTKFSDKSLNEEQVYGEERGELKERRDRLPNLQLLPGRENVSKQTKMPLDWIVSRFEDTRSRERYIDDHDLGKLPENIRLFGKWYDVRRRDMHTRLRGLLGQSSS